MLRPCPVIEEAYCGTVGGDGGSEKRLASWRERGVWAVRLRSSQRFDYVMVLWLRFTLGGCARWGGGYTAAPHRVALCVRVWCVSSTEVALIYC